mgnify:CR=1 FL=1
MPPHYNGKSFMTKLPLYMFYKETTSPNLKANCSRFNSIESAMLHILRSNNTKKGPLPSLQLIAKKKKENFKKTLTLWLVWGVLYIKETKKKFKSCLRKEKVLFSSLVKIGN